MIVSFGAAAYTAIENGDTATVPITLEPMSDEKVTVPVTVTGGDADAYSTTPCKMDEVVFAAGETRKTITVTATPDTDTDTEVITLTLGAAGFG